MELVLPFILQRKMDPRRRKGYDPSHHSSGYTSRHQSQPTRQSRDVDQQYQNHNYPNNAYSVNSQLLQPNQTVQNVNSQSYSNNGYYRQIPQNSVNQGQFYNTQQAPSTSQNIYGTQTMIYSNQQPTNMWQSQPQPHQQIIEQSQYKSVPNTYTQPQQMPLIQQQVHDSRISSNYSQLTNNLNPIYQPYPYTSTNQSNNGFASHNSTSPPQMANRRSNNDSNKTRNQSMTRVPIGTATRTSTSIKETYASGKESRARHNISNRAIIRSNSPARNSIDSNIPTRSAMNIKKNDTSSDGRNSKKRPLSPPLHTFVTDVKKNRLINLYDYSSGIFANSYNFPAINGDCSVLDTPAILSRYNRLKVPDDFVKMEIDWNLLSYEVFTQSMNMNVKPTGQTIMQQSGEPIIIPTLNLSKLNRSENTQSILKPTEFCSNSNLLSQDYNIPQLSMTNNSSYTIKHVVYNAKILITSGYPKEVNCESLDHSFCRNLNILCGNSGNSKPQLLGTSWCKELDGGDPNFDLSCLLNTARRAVLSQSLIDIFTDCSDIVKLCEIVYSRPKGDLSGPEYKEINVIYLCALNLNDKTNSVDFGLKWSLFCNRLHGKTIHPLLNLNVFSHNTNEELYSFLLRDKSYIVSEVNVEELNYKRQNEDIIGEKIGDSGSILSSDITEISTAEDIKRKPETSCILICPQPLPQDIYNNSSKQINTLSLNLLSLNEVLAHSVECNSELLFEAIMAVEMLRSIICIHFANIIVSFILSEHVTLSLMVDLYVVNVMNRLRQINSKVLTILNNSTTVEAITPSGYDNSSENNKSEIVVENVQNKKSKVDVDEITCIDFEVNRDPAIIDVTSISDATLTSASDVSEISEIEARGCRRNFLNSCKWFDKDCVGSISLEILEMIFYLSDIPVIRELSQKEIYSMCSKLCKEENKKLIFRYESFV